MAGEDSINPSIGTIYKFAPNGVRSVFATGMTGPEGAGPTGIAFDASGNLFVADYITSNIYKITPDGTRSTFAAASISPPVGADDYYLHSPWGLAFDHSGNLFVTCNYSSGVIYKFTPDGSHSTFSKPSDFLGGFAADLAFDNHGNLFVADNFANTIFKFSTDGNSTTFATGLNQPTGIVFDGGGNMFVADTGSNRIYEFAPNGTRSIFASGLNAPNHLAFAVPEPNGLTDLAVGGLLATASVLLCRRIKGRSNSPRSPPALLT